ncbi:MAG: peptidoglycan-binding protein [Devosia sp.]|nr:peptidoglycan-binding protein [Devosia sp.]
MTASTLTQLPLQMGGVFLSQLGRLGQWTLARYMRAPAASTGILAMVTLTAMAGSNALYFQTAQHPSPFFGQPRAVPLSVASDAPVPAPLELREQAQEGVAALPTLAPPSETTGSIARVPPAIPEAAVGNAEVFAVQKKLAELKLFDGKVDGYYGPMTARAIRAFEERNGMTPMGALSAGVVAAILNADNAGRTAAPAAAPKPVVQPAPVVQPQAQAAPVVPAALPQPDQVVARLPELSAGEQVFDQVASTAAQTLDTIVAAVDGSRSTPPPSANPPIPTASLPTQSMPAPVQLAATAPVAAVASPPPAAPPATDAALVAEIQSGLASLGFFRGAIDGNPGPETARAIREFENFHRYRITGQVQPDLVGLLRNAGAAI